MSHRAPDRDLQLGEPELRQIPLAHVIGAKIGLLNNERSAGRSPNKLIGNPFKCLRRGQHAARICKPMQVIRKILIRLFKDKFLQAFWRVRRQFNALIFCQF